MYTVAELIEALKQCPQDSEVLVVKGSRGYSKSQTFVIDAIGINPDEQTVDLFVD